VSPEPKTLSLFEDPQPDLKAPLRKQVQAKAQHGIYFGTSSWKYEGWLGQIYSPERYAMRGRFSKKRFEQECLQVRLLVNPERCWSSFALVSAITRVDTPRCLALFPTNYSRVID
jgi:hypothetical protein